MFKANENINRMAEAFKPQNIDIFEKTNTMAQQLENLGKGAMSAFEKQQDLLGKYLPLY